MRREKGSTEHTVKLTDNRTFSQGIAEVYIILHYNMYYFHFTLQEPC